MSALSNSESKNKVYNVANGEKTSLTKLFEIIKYNLKENGIEYTHEPNYLDFRKGDVQHSLADISKANSMLGYNPKYDVQTGLSRTIRYYLSKEK